MPLKETSGRKRIRAGDLENGQIATVVFAGAHSISCQDALVIRAEDDLIILNHSLGETVHMKGGTFNEQGVEVEIIPNDTPFTVAYNH